MNYNAQRIKDLYYPDSGDVSVGRDGQFIHVTWAERALLEMIEMQYGLVTTLSKENEMQNNCIQRLEAQVARLLDAVPQAGEKEL